MSFISDSSSYILFHLYVAIYQDTYYRNNVQREFFVQPIHYFKYLHLNLKKNSHSEPYFIHLNNLCQVKIANLFHRITPLLTACHLMLMS